MKYDAGRFFELFIVSGYAERFGEGDYTLIAGKSGVELARMTIEKTLKDMVAVKPEYMAEKSLLIKKGWRRKKLCGRYLLCCLLFLQH